LKKIREGEAEILVDDRVFYNPKMKFCRDIDMLIFSNLKSRDYLDALSATGVRGIRAKLEAGYETIFNDKNWRAYNLIKKNLELNGVEAEVLRMDASSLMRQRFFGHVDIDPFGSPAEFIGSACFSAQRYLSITATDTAALCGSAKISGLRKYSAFAIKIDCYPEIGLRMLIGKIARVATKYDKGVEVLISWAKEHYYRVHLEVRKSVSFAGKIYGKIGYLFYCPECSRREWTSMLDAKTELCMCGNTRTILGPLWLGELDNKDFTASLMKKADGEGFKLLQSILDELEIPFHYDIHIISKIANASPPKIEKLKDEIEKRGHSFSRTRFSGTGFKTDADIEEIIDAVAYPQ